MRPRQTNPSQQTPQECAIPNNLEQHHYLPWLQAISPQFFLLWEFHIKDYQINSRQ